MRPTEPGWYWYWREDGQAIVVKVERLPEEDGLFCTEASAEYFWKVDGCPGQFVGPLVPPERPKE